MLSKSFRFDKAESRAALIDSETPAVVLYAIITAAYADWLYPDDRSEDHYVEPIELWLQIKKDFSVDVNETVENRINAIRLAVETDLFYENAEAFIAIVCGIASGDIDDVVSAAFDDISVAEILITLLEVDMVRGDEAPEFSSSVLAVMNEELREEAEDSEVSPTAQLIKDHKADIASWFARLKVDPGVLSHI